MKPLNADERKKLADLVYLINLWGIDRNLTKEQGCDGIRQAIKMKEEVEEFEQACFYGDRAEMIDAIGDMFVVLVQMARVEDINLLEAINTAYEEIKDRRGKMIEGVFVKGA